MLSVSVEADVLLSGDLSEPLLQRKDMNLDDAVGKSNFASGKTAADASVCGRPRSFEVVWDYSQGVKPRPQ